LSRIEMNSSPIMKEIKLFGKANLLSLNSKRNKPNLTWLML
jgi:hypothetical protein